MAKVVMKWLRIKELRTFARAWIDDYEAEKESVQSYQINDYLNETEGFTS